MSYVLLPNTGQSLGQTRDQIKENFTIIKTAFNIDHVNYDASGEGKHDKVTLPARTDPTSAASEVILYSKNDSNSAPQLFFAPQSAATPIQMTRKPTGANPVSSAENGYTFLPGGLLLQWGKVAAITQGTVTFSTSNVSFATSCYNVITTPIFVNNTPSTGAAVGVFGIAASGFSWKMAGTTTNYSGFYWVAIGN